MGEAARTALFVGLLGDFRLACGNTPVISVNSARLQAILTYLILHRHAPQSRRHLAFLFWPDSTETQARTNLRHLLHALLHALPDAERFLWIDTQTVQWRPDGPYKLDVAEFEAASASNQEPDLARAVEIYRGDLLPSCYDDWIQPERERLRRLCADALERLVALAEDARDYKAAIAYGGRLLQLVPAHEATYRSLMRLHALNGDRAAALHTYHSCASALRRELGVPPDAATRALHECLLNIESPTVTPRAAVTDFPLVGRAAEWAQLQDAWHRAAVGRPQMALIAGDAGVGKTRLAEELIVWASRQGILTASARGYAAEGELAYAPVVVWLRALALPPHALEPVWLTELARLLPELSAAHPGLPPPEPLRQAWQRNRLFEALARGVLCGSQSRLLVLDDLQWCDRDTLEWLHYLLRFDPHADLLVVGTLRTGENTGPELAALLAALRHDGLMTEIELGPLDASETAALAGHVAGRPLDPALTEPLFQGSEGNPLFVVEMVQAGLARHEADHRRGSPSRHARIMAVTPQLLPAKVRQVIESRLAQLSPTGRELAELAATIGRQFDFDVLSAAAHLTDEVLVRGLDELWQRRIVREQESGAYDFSHDKIREAAYAQLSTVRRRLLHRRVAQALETRHAAALDAVSGQIARHCEQAGLFEPAIAYYRRAADAAQQLYANADAIQYYRRALVLLGEPATKDQAPAAAMWERLGDTLFLVGQYEPARAAYRQAIPLVASLEPVAQARLFRKLGNAWREVHDYPPTRQAYDEAARILGEPPSAVPQPFGEAETIAHWWEEWIELKIDLIHLLYWQSHTLEATATLAMMHAHVEQRGSIYQRARFFIWSALIVLRHDRYAPSEATAADLRQAQAAAQASTLAQHTPFITFQLGFLLLWHGERRNACECLQTALRLAERSGDISLHARCLTYLTIIARFDHDANEVARRAATLLQTATTAQMPEYIAVARANQAWLEWRQGRLDGVQTHGRAALELWAGLPFGYGFAWLALWPLIATALCQDEIAQAVTHTRLLLHPSQQRLPAALTTLLTHAVQAQESSDPVQTRRWLSQALALAEELRYL
ncbi:MAG: AAA family ATPase [Anaerolineae bacterium]|nr:AAA family ATPase [Anaerolineae bacterium]